MSRFAQYPMGFVKKEGDADYEEEIKGMVGKTSFREADAEIIQWA